MFKYLPKWQRKQETKPLELLDGSLFKVPLTTITRIEPHPNADRLEIATIYGFQVIIQKDKYKIGDKVIYVPINSVLNQKLENILFPSDSKIKLHKGRIKQIKIRGSYSQGMIINLDDIKDFIKYPYQENQNYANELSITKYEPPIPSYQVSKPILRNKPFENPYFRKFNGITNIKWEPHVFQNEEVVIQCKLHGSHIRFGKPPFVANTIWKKVKKLFCLSPKYEHVYGSNNVELTNRNNYTGFYGENIYGKLLKKLNAFDKIKDGEFIHAELIGPGVQKGYDYGLIEHHMVIFDVRILQKDNTQKWLNPEEAEMFAKERGFDFVPVLYKGIFSKEVLDECTKGKSVYCPKEIKEGCVVKSRYNYDVEQNKRAFKSINPEYLETNPSDNH